MLELHGPSYRYQGEILEQPEVIWVRDHHYDSNSIHPFAVEQLVAASPCADQHWVVFDHVNAREYNTLKNVLYMPLFLSWQTGLFNQKNIAPDWNSRASAFNFMVNKRRPGRELLLVFLSYFGLTTPDYTLCWKDSNWIERGLLSAMTDNVRLRQIIQDTQMDTPPRMYLSGSEVVSANELIYRNQHCNNADVYESFVKKALFESSCISLITEPVLLEQESLITEKTIMAIYGGTLPIWVGGWHQADVMRDFGFDVFDDIVDHSYQEFADPVERCFYAIQKNLGILRDFDCVNDFLSNNQHRLAHNLDRLKTNVFQQKVLEQYNSSPAWVKSELIKIFEKCPVVIVQGDDCYMYGQTRCKLKDLEKTLPFTDIDQHSLVITL
jgi:hypothetical protein